MKKILLIIAGLSSLNAIDSPDPEKTLASFGFSFKSNTHSVSVHPNPAITQVQPRQVSAFIHVLYTLQHIKVLGTDSRFQDPVNNHIKTLYNSVPKRYRGTLPCLNLLAASDIPRPLSLKHAYATLKSHTITSFSTPFFQETITHITQTFPTSVRPYNIQDVRTLHKVFNALSYVSHHEKIPFIDTLVTDNLQSAYNALPQNLQKITPSPTFFTNTKKNASLLFKKKFLKLKYDCRKITSAPDYKIMKFLQTYNNQTHPIFLKHFSDLLYSYKRAFEDAILTTLNIEHPSKILPTLYKNLYQSQPKSEVDAMIYTLENIFYKNVAKDYLSVFVCYKQPYKNNVRVYINNDGLFCHDSFHTQPLTWSKLEKDLRTHYDSMDSLAFFVDMNVTSKTLHNLVPIQDIDAWIVYDFPSTTSKQNIPYCYTTDRAKTLRQKYLEFFENTVLPAAEKEGEYPLYPTLVPRVKQKNAMKGIYHGMTFTVARVKSPILA